MSRFLLHKAQGGPAGPFIEYRCFARLVPGTAHLKLDGFRQQHRAEATTAPDGTFVFHVRTKGSLWQRGVGRTPGLEVRVRIEAPRPGSALTPVSIRIDPVNCNPVVLQELGPVLLTSVPHAAAGGRPSSSRGLLPATGGGVADGNEFWE